MEFYPVDSTIQPSNNRGLIEIYPVDNDIQPLNNRDQEER